MGISSIKLKRFGASTVLGFLATVLGISMSVSPIAKATATGCNFKSGTSGPYSYCVTIKGSKTWVDGVSGKYISSLELTNVWITAEFFDTGWHWYKTYKSPTYKYPPTTKTISIPIYKYMKKGWMCSTLHYTVAILGNKTMSVCHQIKG